MQNINATLYIVATPIGNLEDITYRAVRILSEVDYVFAEDTRTTGNLFKKYNISTKLISYNSHNQIQKNQEIIQLLSEGKNLAVVSDAGTPGISDPGYTAVREVREFFSESESVNIVSIPGPSALTAFVSVLGVGTHIWSFYGFLPHKNGRQTLLKEMLSSENSSIFYESTHRIEKCMSEIVKLQLASESKRKVAIGKELTKIYEKVMIGYPEEILEKFQQDPGLLKGEFVVMVV